MDTIRQKEAITKILRIESQRLKIKQALESKQSEEQQALSGATDEQQTLPGGLEARTPASNAMQQLLLSKTVLDC